MILEIVCLFVSVTLLVLGYIDNEKSVKDVKKILRQDELNTEVYEFIASDDYFDAIISVNRLLFEMGLHVKYEDLEEDL